MIYTPVRLQAAFYLASIDMSSRAQMASSVRKCAKDYFDIDPVILPFPTDSPPGFPQIIIQNDASGWVFQMATGRFDIMVNIPSPGSQTFAEVAREIQNISSRIFDTFATNFGAKVNRLGFVSINKARIDDAPEFLRKKYLSTDMSSGAAETRLLFLHKYEIHSLTLNKWVRLISTLTPPEIVLEIDINTRTESTLEATTDLVERFYFVVNQLTDETITNHG